MLTSSSSRPATSTSTNQAIVASEHLSINQPTSEGVFPSRVWQQHQQQPNQPNLGVGFSTSTRACRQVVCHFPVINKFRLPAIASSHPHYDHHWTSSYLQALPSRLTTSQPTQSWRRILPVPIRDSPMPLKSLIFEGSLCP